MLLPFPAHIVHLMTFSFKAQTQLFSQFPLNSPTPSYCVHDFCHKTCWLKKKKKCTTSKLRIVFYSVDFLRTQTWLNWFQKNPHLYSHPSTQHIPIKCLMWESLCAIEDIKMKTVDTDLKYFTTDRWHQTWFYVILRWCHKMNEALPGVCIR